MSNGLRCAAIVGATGPTGIHLARELTARGVAVRVVSRSRERLERAFAGQEVELAPADALDTAALAKAVKSCDLVVDAIGLPPERMVDHPRTAHSVVEAASRCGARLLQVSSYWSYLPVQRLPLDESHPRTGGNRFIQLRREAEDILEAAGALVVQLPDFFGPAVQTSTLQGALAEAVAGKAMSWIGSARVERDYAFVPDVMRTVARLAEQDGAYGHRVLLPGSGPLSGSRLAEIVSGELGCRVRVRAAPLWMLRLLALVSRDVRVFLPMLPHYARPLSMDGRLMEELVGPVRTTPYDVAVARTLRWLSESAARKV